MKTGLLSIRTKLLVLFLVFNVIPMGFVALHVYRHAEHQLRAVTRAHMEQLAEAKSLEITRFFDMARLNLISAQNFVIFRSNIPVLISLEARKSDPRFIAAKKLLDIQLIQFASDHGVKDIDIIGLDGHIIYSTDNDHSDNENLSTTTFFREGMRGIYFSDINRTDEREPHYFLRASAPLYDLHDRLIGVVAFEIGTDAFFTSIQGSTGLGASGETLLGKRIGESVVFLNPLRRDPDAALRKRARIGDHNAVAIQWAACGNSGSGVTCDYNGTEVVSAWKYLPAVKWGIVTKIDASEAFAPIIELRRDMLTAGAIALFLGLLFSLGLAHSMAKPIRTLKEGAEQLGHGNLDYRIPVTSKDEIGALADTFNRMVISLKEITESRDRIRHLANHDSLTGLPNRLLLEDRLEQGLLEAKREGRMLGVLFLDLDGFKGVNDRHGHDVGDMLLKEVAGRLCYCVRQSDTVARIGGDEFVIVLMKIKELDNVRVIARKILEAIREEFVISGSGTTLQIGVSIGASVFPKDGVLAAELLQCADAAMYRSKQAGKNTYHLAD
ncbi:MAG TPA: diguanylate cyclase [Desulfuromonadaceae bacterium]